MGGRRCVLEPFCRGALPLLKETIHRGGPLVVFNTRGYFGPSQQQKAKATRSFSRCKNILPAGVLFVWFYFWKMIIW